MLEKVNFPEDLKKLKIEELEILSEEIRDFLIEKVTKTGGHLSPNLGIVELTIALHYSFDFPKDSLIWDVGHQSYVHKILTGRKHLFDKLRQSGGLSGYPEPEESKYDCFHSGHSSTSISLASGLAKAKSLKNDESYTIAVIGDGAFTGGLVYEAINTIAHENLPVIIILNDNGMSISQNVGGIAKYLRQLQSSKSYLHFKWSVEKILKKKLSTVGEKMVKFLYRLKESIKILSMGRNFFEDLGIAYLGPMDGHNIKTLINTFEEVKKVKKPILIHIVTRKGKGYIPSEENPGKYHGISPSITNGDSFQPEKSGITYSEVFGKKLCELAKKDEKIFAITAAMKLGTGLLEFSNQFPHRFSDVGITEDHAILYAAGLQKAGFKPVVAIYSTFLQRGYDELIHDVGIGNYKILFCIDRAGLVADDGKTHQGIFDISYLRSIPNFTIMLPSCKTELEQMMEYAIENLDGPIAIRYPKDSATDYEEFNPLSCPIKKGTGITVKSGKDLILISTGTLLKEALYASKALEGIIDIEVYNLRFAKPLSEEIFLSFSDDRPILIIEEGIENGGVASFLQKKFLGKNQKRKVEIITLPDEFPPIGKRNELLQHYFLTGKEIKTKIEGMFFGKNRK
ncbi:MAG: 1-deoxy-D-xylulose-5-phosphate synthase [Brevinematia bacterium]